MSPPEPTTPGPTTPEPTTPGTASPPLDPATSERVSHGVIRAMKLVQALRHHAPRVHPAVDVAAYPLLFQLAREPRRVSVLADCVHSDVSTVSRQVSSLTSHGLLEKLSDPEDGRAQVVRLSDEGRALLAEVQRMRSAWFSELLTGWSAQEASAFADHLEHFAETLAAAHERTTGRPRPQDTGFITPTTEN